MIDATLELIQTRGYHGTGLAHITAGAAAPRGSLYFHFPGGKDELVAAALDRVGAEFTGLLESLIAGGADAGTVVAAVFDDLAARLDSSGFATGCAIASVAAAPRNASTTTSARSLSRVWKRSPIVRKSQRASG